MSYTQFDIEFDSTFGDGYPVTDEVTPVEAIVDLLQQAYIFGLWEPQSTVYEETFAVNNDGSLSIDSGTKVQTQNALVGGTLNVGGTLEVLDDEPTKRVQPTVYKWWDKAQAERGPGQGQPPELYVWQPTSAPIERISADNVLLEETPSVEIYIYSLDDRLTAQYARDVIKFMSGYMSNKELGTKFADIVPTNVEDFREQKLRQVTNHFVYSVEVEITKLTDTGV